MEKPAISFAFKASTDNGPLKSKSAIVDDTNEVTQQTEFVTAVDGTNIISSKGTNYKKKKEPLVIPLIQKRNRQTNLTITSGVKNENDSQTDDTDLTRLAAKELINAEKTLSTQDDKKSELSIPLLFQNKVSEKNETEELGQAESTIEDYESVPLEDFGLAMLRGMGWKEGQGIGRNNKNVKPVEAHLRPKGMGLGADRSQVLQQSSKKHKLKPGDKREEEELNYRKGVNCVILKGPHIDLYGTIEGVDDDNCRCVVKLSLSQEVVDLSQFALRLVDKQEFDKFSRYLNKGKSDEYKNKQNNKQNNGTEKSSRKRPIDEISSSQPKKSSASDSSGNNKHSSSHSPKHWVQPLLKVKIVDRKYKDGRYYSSKVIVDDVLPDSLVCKTESGRLLEGLRENQLESVIPRESNSHVMVVAGEHKKEIGLLLQRNKDKEQVTVQLLSDRSVLITLHYDYVCEYTGSVHHLLDY
ncbi:G-patch domain and KOW motifs-containing protein-like [Watersipora subatra]|uniref:G-patch domain and KOW motifs-containing protein-like n=1 Tax=Watersipora subatra TaxID=2589382 RepID=UPI00355B4A42